MSKIRTFWRSGYNAFSHSEEELRSCVAGLVCQVCGLEGKELSYFSLMCFLF